MQFGAAGLEELSGLHFSQAGTSRSELAWCPDFPGRGDRVIHKFSSGIPRLGQCLCENSLVSGFSGEQKQITAGNRRRGRFEISSEYDCAAVSPNPTESETRKRFLQRLARMVEEMDARPDNRSAEPYRKPGVKAK